MITTFAEDTGAAVEPKRLERLQQLGGRELVRKMIDLFHAHAVHHVDVLRASNRIEELEEAEAAAHSLKTSAGNLGATRLFRLAMDMEDAAARRTLEAFLAQRPQLLDEFARASKALAQHRDSLQGDT